MIDINKLQKLEESLWKEKTRFDIQYMENILDPTFFEFGRSGRIYQREDTLYGIRPQTINATIPLESFQIHKITDEIYQTTYISEVVYERIERANRSSLWKYTNSGWKLLFHQGTPCE